MGGRAEAVVGVERHVGADSVGVLGREAKLGEEEGEVSLEEGMGQNCGDCRLS